MKGLQRGLAALLCAALCWGAGCAAALGSGQDFQKDRENIALLEQLLYQEPTPEKAAPGEATSLSVFASEWEEIPDLADYPKLEELDVTLCDQARLEELLAHAPNLRTLRLEDCDLTDLSPVLALPHLTCLELWWCDADWSVLAGHPTLRELYCNDTLGGSEAEVLRTMPALEALHFCPKEIDDLTPLNELRSLWSLGFSISNDESLPPLTPLASLPALRSLTIAGTPTDETALLAELAAFTGLEQLYVYGLQDVADLSPLAALRDLQELTLRMDGSHGSNLRPLAELSKLRSLNVSGPIDCLNTLPELPALEVLSIAGGSLDVSLLKHTPALKELRLDCARDTDLNALKALPRLEHLRIHKEMPSDLTPLYQLPALDYLSVDSHAFGLLDKVQELAELLRARPELKLLLDVCDCY